MTTTRTCRVCRQDAKGYKVGFGPLCGPCSVPSARVVGYRADGIAVTALSSKRAGMVRK